MTNSSAAFALAARAHGRNGSVAESPETLAKMRAAAVSLGESRRRILAGPTEIVGTSTLILQLTSPEAVLPASLALASSVRPARTTFCACCARAGSRNSPPAGDRMESALAAREQAASEAAARLSETDFRESRFVVTGPRPADLVGVLLGLILESYDSMTERQRQIVDLVRDSDTQQEVATHLGISRQAVNQSLAAAGWPYLERAEAMALAELSSLWDRPDAG